MVRAEVVCFLAASHPCDILKCEAAARKAAHEAAVAAAHKRAHELAEAADDLDHENEMFEEMMRETEKQA